MKYLPFSKILFYMPTRCTEETELREKNFRLKSVEGKKRKEKDRVSIDFHCSSCFIDNSNEVGDDG